MTRRLLALAALALAVPAVEGQDVRFRAYDLVVDPGAHALGAYQVDVRARGAATLAGVENGVAPFDAAPHYDPEALRGGRVVVAAFTKEEAPPGALRVARLHFRESGDVSFAVAVVAGAKAGGERIALEARLVPIR